jgi:hypothetical protein
MDDLLVEAIRDNIQKYGYSLDPVDLLQNVKAALVAEGWKSPEEVRQIVKEVTYKERQSPYSEVTASMLDQVRADERKAIGKWIEHTYPTYGPDYLVPIKDVDALLKGERQ